MPLLLTQKVGDVYNPVAERHARMPERMLRDIAAGEEILDNYLAFIGHESDWEEDVQLIRDQCRGVDVGEVTKYETDSY